MYDCNPIDTISPTPCSAPPPLVFTKGLRLYEPRRNAGFHVGSGGALSTREIRVFRRSLDHESRRKRIGERTTDEERNRSQDFDPLQINLDKCPTKQSPLGGLPSKSFNLTKHVVNKINIKYKI